MKHIDFIENEYEKFFTHIEDLDFTENGQITTFVKWCFDNGFLDNMTEFDFDWFYSCSDCINLPLLKNHGVAICIEYWAGNDIHTGKPYRYCRVGVDPAKCFDKTSKCSILMYFPMTKRAEKAFYKLLNGILDKSSNISREWFNCACSSWYGSYFNNYI